jgi:hypothetical protein
MFKNLFGKKEQKDQSVTTLKKGDKVISFGDDVLYKTIRQLSQEMQQLINQSPLKIMQTQLFMHYWNPEMTNINENDPTWQNQAIYFWTAEEPFEKKSLPPFFQEYEKKFFVIAKSSDDISFSSGTAIPWFGMPGGAEKIFGKKGDSDVTIKELFDDGIIEYVDFVDLNESNAAILRQNEKYFFLVDNRIVRFLNNDFFVKDKRVPLSVAYEIGGVHIVKKNQTENKEDHSRFMPK